MTYEAEISKDYRLNFRLNKACTQDVTVLCPGLCTQTDGAVRQHGWTAHACDLFRCRSRIPLLRLSNMQYAHHLSVSHILCGSDESSRVQAGIAASLLPAPCCQQQPTRVSHTEIDRVAGCIRPVHPPGASACTE